MFNNFWVNRWREKQALVHRDAICRANNITLREFLGMSGIDRAVLVEKFLKKKGTKS